MRVTFITALTGIVIPDDLGRGDRITDTTFITNNTVHIRGLLRQEYVPVIGTLEATTISNASAVIYAVDEVPDDTVTLTHLGAKLRLARFFLHCLWLAKDNAVDFDLGFLFYIKAARLGIDANVLPVACTKADGSREPTTFTQSELKRSRRLFRRFELPAGVRASTVLDEDTDRPARALYHVQAARATDDLGLKIAAYCSTLEALFATSQGELAHQLAERVACFVEDTPDARLETYRLIKQVYALRSKIVHGDLIRRSHAFELLTRAVKCDSVVREILASICGDDALRPIFRGPVNDLDSYFLSLLFGTSRREGIQSA